MSIRILVADDHQLMREGLRAILERDPEVTVVGEAADGFEALAAARRLRPDVVLMDLGMPRLNGIDATRRIAELDSSIRVIALSNHVEKPWVIAALDAGAAGYVVKAGAGADLHRAIHGIVAGKRYLCAEVAGAVIDAAAGGRGSSGIQALAPREREVLQLVAQGLSSAMIAGRLHISPRTVETHRRNLMQKLDIHNVAGLTRYAVREGLVSLDD